MSEDSRYEKIDLSFSKLPLPDKEKAWQKMKDRLDKGGDDDRILPPVLLKTCAGWTLVSLLLFGGIWLALQKHGSEDSKSSGKNTEKATSLSVKRAGNVATAARPGKTGGYTEESGTKNNTIIPETKQDIEQPELQLNKHKIVAYGKDGGKIKSRRIKNGYFSSEELAGQSKEGSYQKQDDNDFIDLRTQQVLLSRHTIVSREPFKKGDSILRKSIIPAGEDASVKKIVRPGSRGLRFSAGIGEQQQIPIAGQTTVPYSYYGRKGSLADYIPSLYLRLEKNKKWFIQSEFRYGAAQSLKAFSYSRQTKFDSSATRLITTTLRVKKTYYHQLPLSFNYYVLPKFSVGIGGIYSRFYKAIIEQETETRNIQTGAETNSKQIIPRNFTDSFFYKTQVHLLLQADYQWNRFSFGLRYTKDVQPFIKYTKPDGLINQEKNQTIQFMIRYRLWQSKEF